MQRKIVCPEKLLIKKLQPTKISTEALLINSKQSTPPRVDIKKISLLDSRNKMKKNRDHIKTEFNDKNIKVFQQKKLTPKEQREIILIQNSQKLDLKKSSSIKAWSNSDTEKILEFNTVVSRSLDPKHKSSKSEAIDLVKKSTISSNSGGNLNYNSNKQISSKKSSNLYASSDNNPSFKFQPSEIIKEANYIQVNNEDKIFNTSSSPRMTKEKKTPMGSNKVDFVFPSKLNNEDCVSETNSRKKK